MTTYEYCSYGITPVVTRGFRIKNRCDSNSNPLPDRAIETRKVFKHPVRICGAETTEEKKICSGYRIMSIDIWDPASSIRW